MDEIKTLLQSLVQASLKARNEAEEEAAKKEKKDETASNEDVDKRKLIDEVGGILKGKVDEEVWRTIIGKIEKVAYDKSETGTADNGKAAKNEDDEAAKKAKEEEAAKNLCKNEEDGKDYKKLYEELKEKVGKEAENGKAKNSLDALKKVFFEGEDYKPEKLYMTQREGIELGRQLY